MRGALAICGIMCKGEIQITVDGISFAFLDTGEPAVFIYYELNTSLASFSRILTSVLLAAARLMDAAAFVVAHLESLADASPCVAPQSKQIAAISSDVVL
jgi:hypothetical protein